MTREEAWKRTKGYLYDILDGEEADEIIKALEQEPCEDCISRAYIEPIIEELENICVNGDEHILDLLANIKNAPPVTPPQSCKDAISRQAAIDAVGLCRVPSHIKARIADLPPVSPLPKTGHWIDLDEKSAVCSCCYRNNTLYGDFCKWCGTKMQEIKDDERRT